MSTERLNLPEVLARPRDHLVICTFGANLDFYEGPLWRYITRARNRVVLADDVTLARQLSDLAAGGSRLHHVNINYIAAPITNAGSAHAKLILLAGATSGTLLVGSGNVSIDGYASRGEVFCRYEVTENDLTYLPEFHTAKDLLDLIESRGYLDRQVRHHLDAVWADTPWIWGPPSERRSVVRHNLTRPLADQLIDAVDGEPVHKLVLHAPFHDPACEALRLLLGALEPQHVTVLVQPGRTSVDPTALERVLSQHGGTSEVQVAVVPDFPETYLHAKFLLVRTSTRSIAFTGSANLSLAALYRTDQAVPGRPAGNIELVNLVEGPLEGFDELLAGLELSEITTAVSALDVRYLGDTDTPDEGPHRPRLRRGTWADGTLMLTAASELPEGAMRLVIAGTDAPAQITRAGDTITVRPAADAAAVLDARAVPVWLRISNANGELETTPVYPYHPKALASLLTSRRDPELLRRSGSLDVEVHDEDLTALLDELDAALVIDRQSLWRLARRSAPSEDATGDGPRRAWEDLDFNVLRQHPKLAQYRSLDRRTDRFEATDLQIVLAAITEHIRGFGQKDRLASQSTGAQAVGMLEVDLGELLTSLPGDSDETPTDQTPEEFESDNEDENQEERERRRLTIETRNRLAWQRFCDRFTRALQDPDFIELVGPNVVLANAIIFNHLLALLIAKGIMAAEKGLDHELELWTFLWGNAEHPGYLATLDEDTQIAAMEEMSERGVESVILGAMDYAAQLTRDGMGEMRTRLRHVWRSLLANPLLHFSKEVLERVTRPGIRSASELADDLDRLSREWTQSELNAAVASSLGTSPFNLELRRGEVTRSGQRASVEFVEVTDPAVTVDSADSLKAFAAIASISEEQDYIRLEHPASRVIAVWDREAHDCWWFDHYGDDPLDLDEPVVEDLPWKRASKALVEAARQADRSAA